MLRRKRTERVRENLIFQLGVVIHFSPPACAPLIHTTQKLVHYTIKNIYYARNKKTMELNLKTTLAESTLFFLTSLVIVRLLLPGKSPLNLNIGGKYSGIVHSLLISLLLTVSFVGYLYLYGTISGLFGGGVGSSLYSLQSNSLQSNSLQINNSSYTHGYSDIQCRACDNTSAPPPPQIKGNFHAPKVPRKGEAGVSYIGLNENGEPGCIKDCY